MNIEMRLRALERIEWTGPLMVFGKPTTEQAIEDPERTGRPVVLWPFPPPPIECLSRKDAP